MEDQKVKITGLDIPFMDPGGADGQTGIRVDPCDVRGLFCVSTVWALFRRVFRTGTVSSAYSVGY